MANTLDLASDEAQALLVALRAKRDAVIGGVAARLAPHPMLQRPPAGDAATRLATVFYGDILATLTFATYAVFARDIRWFRDLNAERAMGITPADEQALIAEIAAAMAAELPEHAVALHALFAHVSALLESPRDD
jgi:hypothetical protein